MNFLYSIINVTFSLIVMAILSGCLNSSAEDSVGAISSPAESVQKYKAAKPGAAIKLLSNSLVSITANKWVHIDVVLESGEQSGELTIEFHPTQGLSLENISMQQSIKFDPLKPIIIPLNLFAAVDGRYYLNTHIRFNNENATSVRNLALIIQAGPVLDRMTLQQKTTGENISVLSAQETISSQ